MRPCEPYSTKSLICCLAFGGHLVNDGEELLGRDFRLDEIGVDVMLHGLTGFVVLVEISQHDNFGVWDKVFLSAAESFEDFTPPPFRQHDVEQHHVIRFVAGRDQAIIAVDHPIDCIAGLPEAADIHLTYKAVVFDT